MSSIQIVAPDNQMDESWVIPLERKLEALLAADVESGGLQSDVAGPLGG